MDYRSGGRGARTTRLDARRWNYAPEETHIGTAAGLWFLLSVLVLLGAVGFYLWLVLR